jgi:hypothetical protein
MPVYMIRAGKTDMVKIGWSLFSPNNRQIQLQFNHYELLKVIRVIEGPRAMERWFHLRFAEQNVRGEWFHLTSEMLTVTPSHDELPITAFDIPISFFRDAASRGLTMKQTAAELNIPYGQVTSFNGRMGVKFCRDYGKTRRASQATGKSPA